MGYEFYSFGLFQAQVRFIQGRAPMGTILRRIVRFYAPGHAEPKHARPRLAGWWRLGEIWRNLVGHARRPRRRLARIGLCAALALVALPLMLRATPAAASTGPLTMSTTSGSAGQRVLLSGSGFTPGETVQPYWDYGTSSALAQRSFYRYTPIVTADSSGNATTDLFVPTVFERGRHDLPRRPDERCRRHRVVHRRRAHRHGRGDRARRDHPDVGRLGIRGARNG